MRHWPFLPSPALRYCLKPCPPSLVHFHGGFPRCWGGLSPPGLNRGAVLHLRLNSPAAKADNESAAAPAPKDQGPCSAPGSPASPACPSKGLLYFFSPLFFFSWKALEGEVMLLLASWAGSGSVGVGSAGPWLLSEGKAKHFIVFSSLFHRLLFPVGPAESRASAGGRCCAGKPLCSSRLNYFQKAAGFKGKEGRERAGGREAGMVCKGGRCLGDVGLRGRAVLRKGSSSHLWEGWKPVPPMGRLGGPRYTRWVTGQQPPPFCGVGPVTPLRVLFLRFFSSNAAWSIGDLLRIG